MTLNTLSITSTRALAVGLMEARLPTTNAHMHIRLDNVICVAGRLGELDTACHFDIVIMVNARAIPPKLTFAGYERIAHIVWSAAHVVLVSDVGAINVSFYTALDNPQCYTGRVYKV